MRKLRGILLCLTILSWNILNAQTRDISGKVTDAKDNTPLAGVSIRIKGTSLGTSSQTDGTFKLTLPSGANTLIFSYLGFNDQEVAVRGNTADVALTSGEAKNLNEIVVVGYGTKIKRDITG